MSLAKLSTELVLWIASHLQPEDVQMFSQTNKRFHNICKDRILWRDLAYQMCFTNKILIPHDIEQLPLEHLQYMSTSPSRVLKRLRAHRQPKKVSADDRTKFLSRTHEVTIPSKPGAAIDQMILIPGGRYMVTLAYDIFTLWDLGISSKKKPGTVKAMVKWRHSTIDGVINTYAPSSDRKGLNIIVSSSTPAPCFTVYRLRLSKDDVDITTVCGGMECDVDDDRFVCWTLVNNRSAYVFDSTMVVWDYEKNQSVKWEMPVPSDECQEIVFDGDMIWLFTKRQLLAWTIPQLLSMEEYARKETELLEPEFTIDIKFPLKSYKNYDFTRCEEAAWLTLQDWYNNWDNPLPSFAVIWTNKGVDKIATYPLAQMYESKSALRHIAPISIMEVPVLSKGFIGPRTVDHTRPCGDSLVQTLYSFETLHLNLVVSSPPTSKSKKMESFRVVVPLGLHGEGDLDTDDGVYDSLHSTLFDPVSGKVARICDMTEDGSTDIVVWDL